MDTKDKLITNKLANGDSITYKRISEDEFVELTQGKGYEMLTEYMTNYVFVYKSPTGIFYANDEGKCSVFSNIDDLNAYVGLKSETKGSKEIMFGRNPFGKDFPMHVSVLIDEIKSELDIKSAAIDLQALVEIDKKINALHERKAFNEKYFLNMIALIGEVFIHEKQPHATWEMQLATDYTSWNPSIKYDNRNIDFLGYLYEDLFLDTPTPPNELLNIYETINGISKNK